MPFLLVCLISIFCLSASPAYAFATEGEPVVTLDVRQKPLAEVLKEIERQTGVFFSYESDWVAALPPVSLHAREEPLSVCLKRLFAPLPVAYRLTSRYVILKKKQRYYTISGFVRDSVSDECLINASVFDRLSGKGGVTNNYGFYSLTLPPGRVAICTSYVGYGPVEQVFVLEGDTLIDLLLSPRSRLSEIVVEGGDPHNLVSDAQLGKMILTPKEIRQVPALLGEPDLVKTLQMMPGVAMGTEAMSSLYVRGGNADENLVLVDGNPIYQIGHLGGLFSAFNPDAVKLAGFYKGSIPARFGERLSSVVDVHTRQGDMYHYHGSASIGLIAGKLNLSGPLVKGRTSFNIALRRTWFDVLSGPAFALANALGTTHNDIRLRYAFHDLNVKLNHLLSSRSRLEAGLYYGDDFLKVHNIYDDFEADLTHPAREGDRFKWRWGNLASSLVWNYRVNYKWFTNLSLFYSRYRSKADTEKEKLWGKNEAGEWVNQSVKEQQNRSRIEDAGLRFQWDYIPSVRHHWKMGSEYILHAYRPESQKEYAAYRDEIVQSVWKEDYAGGNTRGHELAVYAEDDWTVSSRVKMNLGLRFTYFHSEGKGYAAWRPRLALSYRFAPSFSVKASYAEMNQYVHLLSETYLAIPGDLWLPAGKRIRPMVSRIGSVGVYTDRWEGFDCSLEGYYKQMDHLLEYRDNAYLLPAASTWEDYVTEGSGRSYGLEAMVKKRAGRLTGWVGYTLSWSDRLFPALNRGRRYPSRFDNRHKLNIVGTYKLNRKIELTASWTYASGNWQTVPVEEYYPSQKSGLRYGWEYAYDYGLSAAGFYTDSRNNVQLPAYHRLDVGVSLYCPKKNGRMGIWNFSLYNAYCRMNPVSVRLAHTGPEAKEGTPWEVQTFSLLPVIPSFSYTYKF